MRVLFFAPYSGIWESAMPEAVLARELKNAGHTVHMLRCDKTLGQLCPVMSSHGIQGGAPMDRKKKVCKSCIHSRNALDTKLGLDNSVFGDHLSAEDLTAIDYAIASLDAKSWEGYSVNGIAVGRYATYELILNHKLSKSEQIASIWDEYKENLRQCLIAHYAVAKLLQNFEFDRIVVYNSLYSLNRTAVKTGERAGIEWRTIHGGKSHYDIHRTLTIDKDNADDILIARSNSWKRQQNLTLNMEGVGRVTQHLEHLFKAKSPWTYSVKKTNLSAEDLRLKFGIDRTKKVILCCLSSEDERFAADMVDAVPFKMLQTPALFRNNFEWIMFLQSFVLQDPSFHLVIRVHPRMYINKREQITAHAAGPLEEFLNQLAPEITINLPSDNVSLYDLAKIVDVVVNGTSTIGLEMLAHGLPVVNHCPERLFAYPPEFNYVGTSIGAYRDAIQRATNDGRSITNSINAFRFYAFLFGYISISLHDAIPSRTTLSLRRILTWLLLRKNFPLSTQFLAFLQSRELKRVPTVLRESRRLVRKIEDVDGDHSAGLTTFGLSFEQERLVIEQIVSRLNR